jgi:hypothetical protein
MLKYEIRRKHQYKKFIKMKNKIAIKIIRIKSGDKKNLKKMKLGKKSLFKIISNKTNINKKKWEPNLTYKEIQGDEIEKNSI